MEQLYRWVKIEDAKLSENEVIAKGYQGERLVGTLYQKPNGEYYCESADTILEKATHVLQPVNSSLEDKDKIEFVNNVYADAIKLERIADADDFVKAKIDLYNKYFSQTPSGEQVEQLFTNDELKFIQRAAQFIGCVYDFETYSAREFKARHGITKREADTMAQKLDVKCQSILTASQTEKGGGE